MTATKIQPGDDTHLTLLMAPHSLNFVTGADRAALLAYGRDVFAAARDSKCLAQIEEPAQPIAGYRISDPSDPTIKPWLSETPDDNGYKSEPLYAGAAPAAVAPRGEYPHEQMDAMALDRYKVVPSNASMLWSHAVVAGDGTQQLYVGREVECQNMVRKFAGAFLDGAFAFHSTAAAPTAQAAPALEAPAAPMTTAEACAALAINSALHRIRAGNAAGAIEPLEQARAALAAAPQAPAASVDDLAQLVKQLAQALRKAAPNHVLPAKALDYLRRQGLQGSPLRAAPAAPAVDASDTARMDWLEKQVVNVRAPLRYGSRDLFWAGPEEVDGGPDGPSDLRARIDAAQAAAKGAA